MTEETEEVVVENSVPGISEEEYERIRHEALEKAKTIRHGWKMKGGWLECRTCEYPHGSFIGPNKVMTGIDDNGNPIFKNKI